MVTQTFITKSPEPVCEDAERNKQWIYGMLIAAVSILGYQLRSCLICQVFLAAWFCYMLTNNRYQWLYIFYRTIGRDISGLTKFIKTSKQLQKWELGNITVLKIFNEMVEKHPNKVALYFEDEAWTFKQLDDFSNRIAQYSKNQGFKRGDVVGLVMENRPQYVGVWLGFGKIGVVTALININTLGAGLIHSIKVASCKGLLFSSECIAAVEEVQENPVIKDIQLFQFNTTDVPLLPNAKPIVQDLEKLPTTPHTADVAKGNIKDTLLYIYTSGTTNLPKAAVITHARYMMMPFAIKTMANLTEDDIAYIPLPLYHTSGGALGVGQAIVLGHTVVLRKKFSASNFWKDCIKYNCTIAQYIGEICRFLLAQPPSESEKKHKLKMMYGNGLRLQIWQKFVDRFGITDIKEFYGATEGNTSMINLTSQPGAIGFCSRFDSFIYPLGLVRCDEGTGEILRDKNGLCVECQPFEAGVILGKVNEKKVVQAFTGYVDKIATEKKLVRNVIRKGDCYFNSGDVLIMDHYGNFYFKDRTGDTFRWRGENVSTCEVEAVISNIVGLKDVIAYGVQVPHAEGRAGMAAIIDPSKMLNVSELTPRITKSLPSYARPLFIRILLETPMTATYKLKKVDLSNDGFDLDKIKDDLYFLDPKKGYVPLTRSLYDDIVNGKLRL